ncbi:D-aminoacylase [bacterium]|nr:D-aminoacylase [bacterium]
MVKIKNFLVWICVCFLLISVPAFVSAENSPEFDVLFINGRVLDGTGNPAFYADVGIKEGKIAAVGKLKNEEAQRVIDIQGKIIAPGFIDIHCHAFDRVDSRDTWTGKDQKRYFAPNYISQGVTTLVSNQCGHSPLSIAKQKRILAEKEIGPNTLLMIGHNDVRHHVMGKDYKRAATPQEIEQMKELVRQAMEDGAAGLSTGLEYVPSIWSTTDEIVALVKEIVPYGGVYQAHERSCGLSPMWYVPSRDEPGPPTMLDNIVELIEVGKRTGATVVATHIKARGRKFWGASRAINRLINEARSEGVDIWADCYPYNTSGSDGSVVLIPRWARDEDNPQVFQDVLENPEKLKDLHKDIRHAMSWRGGAENIMVMDYPDESYIGKSLSQLAQKNGISPLEMVIKLKQEGDPEKPGGARLRAFSMSEIDIKAFYSQPWTATCSDGRIALPGDGPVHARYYGTFPRKIRRYALEKEVISVADAVRSSTSLPAQIHGIRDRGRLREGYHADIVVFDLDEIKDTATFFEPHQYAEGIEYVLVNGTFVLDEGELTWKRPGKVVTDLR